MRKKKEKNEKKREIGQRVFEGMGKDERECGILPFGEYECLPTDI